MKWDRKKPERIGTYWHADPNWGRGIVKLFDVFETNDGDLGVNVVGADYVWMLNEFPNTGYWAVAKKPKSPCLRVN